MFHAQTIAKNAAWLMMATTLQKGIAFLSFFFVARWNGAEVTGRYFYAVAITSVFVVITDLGLTPVIIREMAADLDRGTALLVKALQAKAILIPVAILASLGYALATGATRETLIAVIIACGVMSCDAISLLAYGVLRGHHRLKFEAVGMLVTQVLTAIVAISASRLIPGNVHALVAALFIGSTWNVGWSVWQWKRLRLMGSSVESLRWRQLARLAIPFAFAGIFVKIYSYVDTLLLERFHDAITIGQYAVAYKITYAFQFLPLTFVAALYPSLSAAYAQGDHEGLRAVFQGSLRLMMLISIPIAVGLSVFSVWIPWLFGETYVGAVSPLSILSWVLIPIFLDFPIGSLLNATHRAGYKTGAMGLAMVANAVANILLVPSLGAVGAAWSGVVSFSFLFLCGLWCVRKDIDMTWVFGLLCRGACATGLIWIVARVALSFFHPALAVLSAVVATLFVLIVLRLFVRKDFHAFS